MNTEISLVRELCMNKGSIDNSEGSYSLYWVTDYIREDLQSIQYMNTPRQVH